MKMVKNILYYGGAAALCAALLTSAHAQQVPAPGVVAGIPQGVSVVLPPPPGFDPVTATPTQRAQFELPPGPDPVTAPVAYKAWAEAMRVPRAPLAATRLTPTDNFAGPAVGTEGTGAASTSSNWSGAAVLDSNNPFTIEAIQGEYTIPIAQQAFSTCDGKWDSVVIWVGMDGWNSKDVLQAGVENDAYCSGSTKEAYYSAWIEWFPNSWTRVSSPAISPGDLLFVEVWNTSSTLGYAYFADRTTNVAAEYKITAPSGTTLTGNVVEWIDERPAFSGTLANLANYIFTAWGGAPTAISTTKVQTNPAVAWNYKASKPTDDFMCVSKPPAGTWFMITMNDNSGKAVSTGVCENGDFMWTYNEGSSH
jgi:hypothetical protein